MSDDFEVVREAVMCIVEDDHAGRERLGRDALAALERIRAEHARLAELCKPVVIRELNLETGEVTTRPSTHRRDLAVAKAVLEAAAKLVDEAARSSAEQAMWRVVNRARREGRKDAPELLEVAKTAVLPKQTRAGDEVRALDLERILENVKDPA